jgi:hypothetical protein
MSKSVRIPSNTNNKAFKTVNIVTSGDHTFPTYALNTNDDRTFPTVQDSGGTVKGLPTIIVPGYQLGDLLLADGTSHMLLANGTDKLLL